MVHTRRRRVGEGNHCTRMTLADALDVVYLAKSVEDGAFCLRGLLYVPAVLIAAVAKSSLSYRIATRNAIICNSRIGLGQFSLHENLIPVMDSIDILAARNL